MKIISIRPFLIASCLLLPTIKLTAQFQGDSTWLNSRPATFKSIPKKWLTPGLTFTQGFTSIEDASRNDYFVKPSLSGGATLSFNPIQWVSLTSGITHEQHGAGILLNDDVGGIGNPDSTYRTRLRLNTWGIPMFLTVRTPELFDKTRISASYGMTYQRLDRATKVFHSVEDGFHQVEEYTEFFVPGFWTTSWSMGLEIEVPGSAVLQIHYVASRSRQNVYQGGPFGSATGILVCHGLKLSTVF